MALAAGLIPAPSAFTSLEDRFVFAYHESQLFHADRTESRTTLPVPAHKALTQSHTYLQHLLEQMKTICPESRLFFDLSLLVALLDSSHTTEPVILLQTLGNMWKYMPELHAMLKALPPLE